MSHLHLQPVSASHKGRCFALFGELIMYPRILLSGISERFREYIFRKGRKKEL